MNRTKSLVNSLLALLLACSCQYATLSAHSTLSIQCLASPAAQCSTISKERMRSRNLNLNAEFASISRLCKKLKPTTKIVVRC